MFKRLVKATTTSDKFIATIRNTNTITADDYRQKGDLKKFQFLADIGESSILVRKQILSDFAKISSLFPKLKNIISIKVSFPQEDKTNVVGSYKKHNKTITIYWYGEEHYRHTLFHELAHAIVDIYGIKKKQLKTLDIRYANEYDSSFYSSLNHEEFFCELFANYHTLRKGDNRYETANSLLVEFFSNLKG